MRNALDADNDGFNDDVDQFPNEKNQWDDGDLDGKGTIVDLSKSVKACMEPTLMVYKLNTQHQFHNCIQRRLRSNRDNDGRKDPTNQNTQANRVQIKKESLAEDLAPSKFVRTLSLTNEWADNDEDGNGDNADQDDDNDGVSDKVEEDAGTDSFNSADKPFAGVTLPVLDVKLQNWDPSQSVLAVQVLCTSHSRSFHAIEELKSSNN